MRYSSRRFRVLVFPAAVLLLFFFACAAQQFDPAAGMEQEPRFQKMDYDSIRDLNTGLEWFVGPDRKTYVSDAHSFVRLLDAGGHRDWRIPTITEIRTLHGSGPSPQNLDPIFATTGEMIWSTYCPVIGHRYLRLKNGSTGYDTRGKRKHGFRVFAVRNF